MPASLIGIGIGEDRQKVLASIMQSGLAPRLVCYCRPGLVQETGEGWSVRETEQPEHDLAADLCSGRLAAAVRGTLPANPTLSALRKAAGVDHLERAALLETAGGRKFFLAPVGVDEGWTVAQQVALIARTRQIARRFGLSTGVAVLSGGRLGDAGRHPAVDQSMAQAELVARLTGSRHFEILIEDAVQECGVIIAPDGISGNLIFRTLTFLGSGHGHGAPVLNIDRIFVDTSRASPGYVNAIQLAESLQKE